MIKTKHILLIFAPAVLLIVIIFWIRLAQYNLIFKKPNITQEQIKPELELIPIFPDDPVIGEVTAGKTVVVFEDFACQGCKNQMVLLDALRTRYPGRIKIIWKGLSVKTFPVSSEPAQRYAYCANQQNKFEEFKNLAFDNTDNLSPETLSAIVTDIELDTVMLEECLATSGPDDYVERNKQLATLLNIQSVPAIFIDNEQVTPPAYVEGWETILQL